MKRATKTRVKEEPLGAEDLVAGIKEARDLVGFRASFFFSFSKWASFFGGIFCGVRKSYHFFFVVKLTP